MSEDPRLDKYKLTLNNGKSIYYIEITQRDKNKILNIINIIDNISIYQINERTSGYEIYSSRKIKTKLDKYFKTLVGCKTSGCYVLEPGLILDFEDMYTYYVEFKK